ncbi:hypothetical protein ACIGXM_00360 [Kitasatospora sp. NPDC052896]|uniref:hypothetical protein n=1 Tax=Kitasatospora sp. NPDC052896 TaxID=3364061 RepID=UPI0037CAA562
MRRTTSPAAAPGRPSPREYRRVAPPRSAAFGWAAALLVAALTAGLATGCGIRPTAVPVDAGSPAVRTACPSPGALGTPTPASPKGPVRLSPTASAVPAVSTAPSVPTAGPGGPTAGPSGCG